MRKKAVIEITITAFIVGFMIAMQYNTMQKPSVERDTRDVLEIRQALSEEKKQHSKLLSEIASTKNIINQYENPNKSDGEALKETVENLKKEAGLTKVKGPGVTMTISQAEELVQFGYSIEQISPDLLRSLVNEIYKYNGKYLEIDGQRVVQTSAIRDINGNTTVNGKPISNDNLEIRVITENLEEAEKLYSYLYSSSMSDAFYIDNLVLDIHEAKEDLTISAYDGALENMYLNDKGE